MSLSGTFDTMPVVDLTTWLAKRARTGILTCKRGSVNKSLTLDRGGVVSAGSNDPREYFGQFLINFGLITEDQLQKAFETQQETKVLLGKILVMTGLLTEEQVFKMLNLKIQETILDIFLWSDGAFEFADGVLPDDPSVVHVEVPLTQLVSDGKKRLARYNEIRGVIPDNASTFSAGPASPTMEPTSPAGIVLELARQGLSAADIILRFHSLDYPILTTLFELVQQKLLLVGKPTSGLTLPLIEVDLTDITDEQISGTDAILLETENWMKKREFEQAVAVLRRGLEEHPYDPDLTDALEVAEKGLTQQLRAEFMNTTRVPAIIEGKQAEAEHAWSPAQRYILSRIDGHRHLKSIVMVSPLKEVDALLTIRALAKAGVIELN